MNAKKIGDMIVKIQYPCLAQGNEKNGDNCKDPCQGKCKEKDECKEKRYNFFRQKFIYSDHSAKCTSSQTENKQATQARQLLICTRSQSSFIWSDIK